MVRGGSRAGTMPGEPKEEEIRKAKCTLCLALPGELCDIGDPAWSHTARYFAAVDQGIITVEPWMAAIRTMEPIGLIGELLD